MWNKKLYWANDYFDEGNAFGYSVHNSKMRQEVSKLIDLDKDSDISLSILSGDKYLERVPNKKNYLFTMFELADIPRSYAVNIQKADHLIVPCNWCKTLFEKYYDGPISVCQEGSDPSVFTYIKREMPQIKPFRFLWVGAPNPRKGYEEMIVISKVLENIPNMELYLKTSVLGQYEKYGNTILDSRRISAEELVELYHSAHAFILPSRGEGWGLTLTEALMTGLPSIAPRHTGHMDFFDEIIGYPCRFEQRDTYEGNYDLSTKAYFCNWEDIIIKMRYIIDHYSEALMKGKMASKRMAEHFTWQNAAKRLVSIIEEAEA